MQDCMNPMNPLSAVIFDFDGVLADTERLHMRAFQRALATVGLQLEERDYYDRYLGYTDRELIVTFARDHGIAADHIPLEALLVQKAEMFAEAFDAGDALFPGARESVRRLAAVYPLGIASGALRAEIEPVLAAAGLQDEFPVIVCADDGLSGKPAPDMYLAAAEHLKVAPDRCVAIEDSPWGLSSAAAAGMQTIGVMSSYRADALRQATRVVATISDVTLDLIDQLTGRAID